MIYIKTYMEIGEFVGFSRIEKEIYGRNKYIRKVTEDELKTIKGEYEILNELSFVKEGIFVSVDSFENEDRDTEDGMSKINDLYKKAIEKWGEKAQLEMAQEEATELALAIRKFIRKPDEKTFDDLSNEISDIEIMIEQIKFMHPEISDKIKQHKEFKLDRLSKRISE